MYFFFFLFLGFYNIQCIRTVAYQLNDCKDPQYSTKIHRNVSFFLIRLSLFRKMEFLISAFDNTQIIFKNKTASCTLS